MGTGIVTVNSQNGPVQIPTDLLAFSALRCFASAVRQGTEKELYQSIARDLIAEPGPVAMYRAGPFLDGLLSVAPEMSGKVSAIVDPSVTPGKYGDIPVVAHWQLLPANTRSIFLCELLTELRLRLRRVMEQALKVLCPDILTLHPELIPQEAWVMVHKSIYPIIVPDMEIRQDLDVLLLNLPARNNFSLPLSFGYVHKELKKSGINHQTLDADTLFYHRFHIWRLFDLGENVVLENGRPLAADPWDWSEECWMDPRAGNFLLSLFARDIHELVTKLVSAQPKVLAMTIHQRNEWIARTVARQVKAALPNIQILVGGHSCVYPTFGPRAFPEYDYMVIGEAEPVLRPLLQQLVAGERPKDLPGIVSRGDSPGRVFKPARLSEDLDEIGSPEYDWFSDFGIFRTYQGTLVPYVTLTRGCIWGRCSFCAERFPFRSRSAKSFVDELERFTQMGLQNFNFSESDFGGQTEVLSEVADEILRRGLKLQLNGQLRINKLHDPGLLKKLAVAGIGCNFGVDGLTAHTLKLQRKGYSLETVKKCLSQCKESGLKVQVNLVVGVPGETEQDVEDTIQFIIDHRSFISEVWNISPFFLIHGCIYWEEPEKHGIRFWGDKKFIYDKYFHAIPDRYWYSVDPYIDGTVRRKRAYRIMSLLRQAGIPVSYFAENSVIRPMFEWFQNPRDLSAEIPPLLRFPPEDDRKIDFPCRLTNYLQDRVIVRSSNLFMAFHENDLSTIEGCSDIKIYNNDKRRAKAIDKASINANGSFPLVSIILVCRNAARTIERSVKSVLGLDYPNIEYVVQDGASTDGTLEILTKYARLFGQRMKLVSEPDAGVEDGFHRALDRCAGRIIGSCLADDELLPNAVTFAVNRFQEQPDAGVIHGDIYSTDLEGNILAENPARPFDLVEYLSHHGAMHLAASFFHIDALQKAGLFNHDWFDDFDLWCRLSLHAKIIYSPIILAKYALSSNQLSERPGLMANLIANRARFIDKFLQSAEVPEEVRSQRKDILINFYSWATQTLTMKNLPDEANQYADKLQQLKKLPMDCKKVGTSVPLKHSPNEQPVLSILCPGRNDSYRGNLAWRLSTILNKHAENITILGLEKQVELIVSDWGSASPLHNVLELTENARRLVKYLITPAAITSLYDKDAGFSLPHALNSVARRANGRYVMFSDSDVYLPTDTMAKLLYYLKRGYIHSFPMRDSFFWASKYHIPYDFIANSPYREHLEEHTRRNLNSYVHEAVNREEFMGSGVCLLMRREMWLECTGWDERLIYRGWNDIDFTRRLLFKYRWDDLGNHGLTFFHLEHYGDGCRPGYALENKRGLNPRIEPTTLAPNPPNWGLADHDLTFVDGYGRAMDPSLLPSLSGQHSCFDRRGQIRTVQEIVSTSPLYHRIARRFDFDPAGWFSNTEAVHALLEALQPQTVCDMGSWMGASARCFAAWPSVNLVACIDPWDRDRLQNYKPGDHSEHLLNNMYEQFLANAVHSGTDGKICPIRLDSDSAVAYCAEMNQRFDLIYIDGDHTTVGARADILQWYSLLNDGGYICGDDWTWQKEPNNVAGAVVSAAREKGWQVFHHGNFWLVVPGRFSVQPLTREVLRGIKPIRRVETSKPSSESDNIIPPEMTNDEHPLTMKKRIDEAKKYQEGSQELKKLPVDPMKSKTSKVLLVSLSGLNTGYEPIFPLGIGYLLAAIRQERPAQAVHYQVFEHATQQLPKIMAGFQPEIVGLTCSTFNRGNVRKICAWLRQHHPRVKIILGGVHASFLAEQAIRDYGGDCVVIGEGELTFRELCNALDKDIPLGGVKGIAYREGEEIVTTAPREVVHNLDDLPLPDYSYAGGLMRKSGMGFVITSRGCPVRCHFCSTGSYWGQRVRIHSPRRVVDEMEALISNYGVKKIFFHDDTFNLGTKRVGEICDGILARKLGVEWGVSCRVHPVSPEMIDRMVAAGCRHICWGIESGSAQMLARIKKKITQEQITRAYELCRKHLGTISVGAFTLVGNPGESEETIAESAGFINTLPMTDRPSTAILCILPGTQLYQEVREKHPAIERFWAENDGVPLYTLEHPLERLQQWFNEISRSGNLVSFDRTRHFWNNVLFGNIPPPSVPALSFLESLKHVIPPEIKEDDFYYLIQKLARTERLSTVLEIGSSAGEGSTEAFVNGLSENPHGAPQLFCMEVSKPRYAELARRYADKPFVHCYNTSSVPLKGFPSPKEVEAFYHDTKTSLNNYPLDRVLGWLAQDIDYVGCAGMDEDGIERVKRENDIDYFDMVLIDGSEFTGKYELDKVYGAGVILLDDINGFKNYANYRRLAADKNYQLIAENRQVRNGYAAFRRIADPLPIHFFTIVLNGEPFIRHHINIFRQLPFPWHWHIVEGVADLKHDTGWSLQFGGRITDELHCNGLSNDGTTEYLNELVKEFPEEITVYRKPDRAFWDGKLEMVRAPLASIREECLLWQVDADELWTPEQICHAREMFAENPEKTAAYYLCRFFVGEKLITTTRNSYGNHTNYEWLRTWRFQPGDEWLSHEPPRLCRKNSAGQWQDLAALNTILHAETESRGLIFHHYAYATEEQLRFKEIYYGYADACQKWRSLNSAPCYPVRLSKYFAWVTDDTQVDTIENQCLKPLATKNGAGEWIFGQQQGSAIPKSILWLRTDSIGDSILAASTLPPLREKFPAAHLTVVCQEHIAELYQSSPYVDEIIGFDRKKAVSDENYRKEILGKMRAKNADMLLNTVYSREHLTDILALESGAEETIAFSGDLCNITADLRDKANKMYSKAIQSSGTYKNELERFGDFLKGMGIEVPILKPSIWINPEDHTYADRFFNDHRLAPEKTIALFASAQSEVRSYSQMGMALRAICREWGLTAVALGSEKDFVVNQQSLDDTEAYAINLSGKTTLRQSAALLKRCRLAVGVDTSLAHIACAVGVPNVAVLGGGHFGRFLPYSPLTSIVCLPLECYHCNWQCQYSRVYCIKDISPEVLAEAIRQTLVKTSEKPRIFVQGISLWEHKSERPRWQSFYNALNVADAEIIPVGDIPSFTAGIWEKLKSMDRTAQVHFLKEAEEEFIQHGEKLFSYNDFEGAELSFSRALELQNHSPKALNNLGVLYYTKGDKERAREHYEAAVKIQPDSATFLKNLADFYYIAQKDTEKALQMFVRGLSINPGDIEILMALGRIAVENGQFESAKDFYKRVFEIDPGNRDAGRILELLNKQDQIRIPEKAEATLRRMVNPSAGYLVSAIVSLYNSERFIRGCIDDLEAQTIADRLEIVIVDSGSPQNERAIVEEMQGKHSNIKYIRTEERETVYAAWNRGIKAASGKYITNANTDDRHRHDALQVMVDELERKPEIALVYADVIVTEKENETFERHTPCGYFKWHDWDRDILLEKGCFMGPQPMWRRSIHDQYGYFDGTMTTSGDYEFWLRISQTNDFYHIRESLGLYLQSPDSIEHRSRREQAMENEKILIEYREAAKRGMLVKFLCLEELKRLVWERNLATPAAQACLERLASIAGLEQNQIESSGWTEQDNADLRNYIKGSEFPKAFALLRKAFLHAKADEMHLEQLEFVFSRIMLNQIKWWPTRSCSRTSLLNSKKPAQQCLASIIISHFKGNNHIRECIETIEEYTSEAHEIIILTDERKGEQNKWFRKAAQKNKHFIMIETEKTAGSGAAYNLGIKASSGEFLVLLNEKAVVTENWLSGMIECLHRDANIGIVGPMSNGIGGVQKDPNAVYKTIMDMHSYAKAFREKNRQRRISFRRVNGFCMLFRRELSDKIGLFDENLPGNGAADDYCLRAALQGRTNVIAGDVFVHHYGNGTFSGTGFAHGCVGKGNQKAFLQKWNHSDPQTLEEKKYLSLRAREAAQRDYDSDQLKKAVDRLMAVIKLGVDEQKSQLILAETLLDGKQYNKAWEILHPLANSTPEDKKCALLGYCQEGMLHVEEADRLASQALALNPNSALALNLKGILAYRKQNVEEATQYFQRAMAADGGYGEPYSNLGVIRWEADQKEEALQLFERGFILSPTAAESAQLYHSAVTEKSAFGRAEPIFREARALHPFHKRVQFLLIDILLKQEKYEAAMEEIAQAMICFGIDEGLLEGAIQVRRRIGPQERPFQVQKTGISLCMIVKNEEKDLPRCLCTVKPIVDEMILVDTGSSDRTKDIGMALGAKVFDFVWQDDFSAPRNFALSKAKGDWILVLDADELISGQDFPSLLTLTRKGKRKIAYSMVTRNYTNTLDIVHWTDNDGTYEEETGSGWFPSEKVRLFPRHHEIHFENPVHEFVEPSLERMRIPIRKCGVPVHHYGKLNPDLDRKKGEEYFSLGKKKLQEMGSNIHNLKELAVQANILGRYEEAIELWDRVIKLQPRLSEPYINLTAIYTKRKEYQKALDCSRRAMELDPDCKEAVLNYSIVQFTLGNKEEVVLTLEENLAKFPEYPLALGLLSVAYMLQGEKGKAFGLLEQIRKMGFNDKEYYQKTAEKLIALGRREEAEILFRVVQGEASNKRGIENSELDFRPYGERERIGKFIETSH